MNILVDTSCLIEFLRATDKAQTIFAKHFLVHDCFVSSITIFELWAGATNQTKQNDVNALKQKLQIIDFSETIAEKSGLIFQSLKQKHQNIGNNDIYIAATAIMHNLPLLTNNQRHFQKIENLILL